MSELYQRMENKISKMALFTQISQLGSPTKTHPVNLFCEIGNGTTIIYISKDFGKWSIDWSHGETDVRIWMKHLKRLKTQKEVFEAIEMILRKEI